MRAIVLLVAVVSFCSGCSNFRPQQRLNLAPFAEYTVQLAADIEYGAATTRFRYLREYRNEPALVAHREYWDRMRELLRGVVAYSVEISTLGASSMSEPDRNVRFADFLDRLIRPVLLLDLPEVRFTMDELDQMLANIRGQEKFLDALREAQPFIDELARLADELFDATEDDMANVFATLDAKIAEDNAGPVQTRAALVEAQERIFTGLVGIREYMLTRDTKVLEQIYEEDPEYRSMAKNPMNPTTAEILTMRQSMLAKLQVGIELKELITPDITRYHEQQQELDDIYGAARLQLKKARITVIVWARAHRNLSEGVTDPARVDIFDLTKKAVSTAL